MLMLNGEVFTRGSQPYFYGAIATEQKDKRVILEVVIEGFRTHAMLDTGAAFIACSPSVASQLRLDPTKFIDRARLHIRGKYVTGVLYRMDLTLAAEEGDQLTITATTFIPDPGIPWVGLPSIIGLEGCLEQVRFALDTSDETFYFGAHP
jgi:hypothetical protein